MDWLFVLLASGATWRLSSLLVHEDGPWKLFRRLRRLARAGEWSQEGLNPNRLSPEEIESVMMNAGRPEGFFSGLLSCIWCTSVWVGGGIVLMHLLYPAVALHFCLALALSTAAIMIEKVT